MSLKYKVQIFIGAVHFLHFVHFFGSLRGSTGFQMMSVIYAISGLTLPFLAKR